MNPNRILLVLGIIVFLFSCSQNNKEYTESVGETNDSSYAFISSSAAVENPNDTSRKFIRTADLKFKVKNVISSTYDIERITTRQNGFVEYTNLSSDIDNVINTAVSADSSLETTYYTVTNSMIIRVPNFLLDTTLKEISRNIEFLDHRIIKAQDVAFQILANSLTKKRTAKTEERLKDAIDNRGKKLEETTTAEELLFNKQAQSDKAEMSNLSLQDQINFSTIYISIYQRQAIKRELLSNNKNIAAYEPGFRYKLLESIKVGWEILETFIVSLTKLWGLLLLALFVYIFYRIYRNKKRK